MEDRSGLGPNGHSAAASAAAAGEEGEWLLEDVFALRMNGNWLTLARWSSRVYRRDSVREPKLDIHQWLTVTYVAGRQGYIPEVTLVRLTST